MPGNGESQRLTLHQVRRRLRQINPSITLLSKSYKNATTHLSCQCKCGHRWCVIWKNLSQGQGCPACAARTRSDKNRRAFQLSRVEVQRRLKTLNPKVRMTGLFQNCYTRMTLVCLLCQTQWTATWNNLKQGRCVCPNCGHGKRHTTEAQVRKVLERLTGWKFLKARPEWLRGRSGRTLELDGYNERHKVAFEYQGEQHYLPIYGRTALKTIQRNDERKRVLAYRNGVALIRVPYWKRDVEAFLRQKLEDMAIR